MADADLGAERVRANPSREVRRVEGRVAARAVDHAIGQLFRKKGETVDREKKNKQKNENVQVWMRPTDSRVQRLIGNAETRPSTASVGFTQKPRNGVALVAVSRSNARRPGGSAQPERDTVGFSTGVGFGDSSGNLWPV